MCPRFVYVEASDGLQSIVCGEIQLTIHDTKESVVDGTSADPWAHSYGAADATVACGCESGDLGGLWIESGVVRASGFPLVLPRRDPRPAVDCTCGRAPRRARGRTEGRSHGTGGRHSRARAVHG